jgi:hypothetical protein
LLGAGVALLVHELSIPLPWIWSRERGPQRYHRRGMPARLLFLCVVMVVAVEARSEERDGLVPTDGSAGRALEAPRMTYRKLAQ